MQNMSVTGRKWSSKAVFILAAVGSAVGLGNLWRFPFVAGENGGGAFVLFYLLCVLLIGLPVLVAELFIGRLGGMSAVGSVVKISRAEGRSVWWALQSWTGMTAAFIIQTFYSVIAGWVLAYIVMIAAGLADAAGTYGLSGLVGGAFFAESTGAVDGRLDRLLADPGRMILYHGIFTALTVCVVMHGIRNGIEKVITVLMPGFFILLAVLVLFAAFKGDFTAGAGFLLDIRPGELLDGMKDGSIVSAALGQAFFSIGLGSALMMTYGAYIPRDQDIPRASRTIVICDTAAGILAGLAIFPVVFATGLEPGAGPTLMFRTLPLAFHGMPGGGILGLMFFVLAFFAAFTSALALLEACVSWLDEQFHSVGRAVTTPVLGLVIFLIGTLCALSQVPADSSSGQVSFFSTWEPLGSFYMFKGMKLLDFFNALTEIMLVVSGLMTAVFAGWAVSRETAGKATGFRSEKWFRCWRFLVRYVCPAGILFVIVHALFIAPLMQN